MPPLLISPIACGLPWIELASVCSVYRIPDDPRSLAGLLQLISLQLPDGCRLIERIPIEVAAASKPGPSRNTRQVLISDLGALGHPGYGTGAQADAWGIDAWALNPASQFTPWTYRQRASPG